jgi:hypothetical protein
MIFMALLLISFSVFFLSCPGGNGDDDGQDGLGNPQITITSHSDGQDVYGNRTITLSGTLSDSRTITVVYVNINGTDVSASFTQSSFSVDLTLDNRTNTITVRAINDQNTMGTETIVLQYPFVTLTTFQNASVVIGQPDFVSNLDNQGGSADANTVYLPYGNALVYNGVLYLPDYYNNRVLGFNPVPTTNNESADFVLGQPDFTTTTDGNAANEMYGPQTVKVDSGRMLIDDFGNNRVLIWNTVPTSTQVSADVVVGQTGFGLSGDDCTQSRLYSPESIETVDGKLIVTDTYNNRVLIWNTIPTSNGAPADIVLGQNSFTNGAENDDDQDGSADLNPTARTLYSPSGVWSDGTRLIVADSDNNRVLIWNTFPTSNFTPADVVLGQSDMISNATGLSDKDMNFPYHMTSNGNQLFVGDDANHRVLIWNSIPTTDYTSADVVLGQSDFVHGTMNDDDQDNADDGQPSARTLYYPDGIYAYDDKLIVADTYNSRYLIFVEL